MKFPIFFQEFKIPTMKSSWRNDLYIKKNEGAFLQEYGGIFSLSCLLRIVLKINDALGTQSKHVCGQAHIFLMCAPNVHTLAIC